MRIIRKPSGAMTRIGTSRKMQGGGGGEQMMPVPKPWNQQSVMEKMTGRYPGTSPNEMNAKARGWGGNRRVTRKLSFLAGVKNRRGNMRGW